MLNTLPTARLLAFLAGGSVLFLVSPAAAVAADVALVLAAIIDAVRVPGPGELRVRRRVPARVSLDGRAEFMISVRNTGERAAELLLTDDLPRGLVREGPDVFSCKTAARRTFEFRYKVMAKSRGEAVVGDIHVRVSGPLGLVRRQSTVERSDAVLVQPGLGAVKRYRLLGLRRRLEHPGERSVRRPGGTGSFESLREYVRGDDPRRIDWKATARRDTPIVRRYEVERSQNVLLAIDAGRLMMEQVNGHARMDHALAAALLLAEVAGRYHDRVGLLVFGETIQRFIPPGRMDISRLADALGRIQMRLVEPDYPAAFNYLARRLRRRSLVVLFTDLIDAEASHALIRQLGHAASRHLPLAVVIRNPALNAVAAAPAGSEPGIYQRAAAEELLDARGRALAAMRRRGVLVADVDADETVPAAINRYLEVKRRAQL